MIKTQFTNFKRLSYRKAINRVKRGDEVFRLRPNGENLLVININDVRRKRFLARDLIKLP